MTNGVCFEFQSVSKTYAGQAALSNVSFTVASGGHTAILGPSGCGKSTSLRLLAGLEAPSAGKILFGEEVISEPGKILRPPHLRRIAMVFQDLALWPNLSVLDNVLLGLSGSGLSRRDCEERAREALALCAIETLADRLPGTISGGEQQRAALARAIAVRPAFLLLDEPFSGLDLVIKIKLLEDISRLARECGMTILLVTHDPLEAKALCNLLIVLNHGTIEEKGGLNELLRTSQSELIKVFRERAGLCAKPGS